MTKSEPTKNDGAWECLFEKYSILKKIEQDGGYSITADQIRDFREPRLMAKFDHRINLPEIFSKNNLSILPITRGKYFISHINTYHTFENPEKEIIHIDFPSHIQSISPQNIPSEAIALNCAFITGIMEDFLEDSDLCPTVNGRMGADSFSFEISSAIGSKRTLIQVNNSQIEIDAAYEGVNYLSLIEAKCDISDDFLVRQIYYPYRVWKDRVSKRIKLVYLVYSNSIFSLYEYCFDDPNYYNSLRLNKQKHYSIENTDIEINDIMQVSSAVSFVDDPFAVPFPQANNFKRIINLCELLQKSDLTREDVTSEYAFDIRQTNYYTDAGRYLGLIKKDSVNSKITYSLTDYGRQILKMQYKQRQLEYVRCILSHRIFHEVLRAYFETGEMPNKDSIVEIMKLYKPLNIKSEDTYRRRSSTIKGWINWIIGLLY
ncbi:MAG: hypothetical protein JXQ82_08480 [Methanomicrobiaceae archaeon]|nr:hypothetical protein [Methanomicrobiaceae archaeon]